MEDYSKYVDMSKDFFIRFTPKVLLAILIFILGFWIAKKIAKLFQKMLDKTSLSKEVNSFLVSFADIAMKGIVIFIIAGVFGINTASFIAILGALAFAVGMALQGSLGNFAAGIIILLFKPYRVDDWIEFDGRFGKVIDIQIFNTHVITPGNKVLIIPNGEVISGVVSNYSMRDNIRMELNVTMPYSEDFPRVKEIILKELDQVTNVLKSPSPEVGIESFDSHNIIISVRPYVIPDHYWEVYYEAYARIKAAFSRNNIQVAYSEGVEMGKIGE